MLAVATLWEREVIRFVRQRSRLVGALVQPVVFWLLLGGGLSASFQPAGTSRVGYLEYFYPGVLALVLLFTAIFTTISTVEDRQAGFLQGVLVAPVGRAAIVLGQALGGTTLAVLQGLVFLALAPLAGVPLDPARVAAAAGVMTLLAFALVNLGLTIAWRLESTQGFHAIMNLILIPLWLLSGAFFPQAGAPPVLAWLMRLDPLTYGMAALRRALYLGGPATIGPLPGLAPSLAVLAGFALATFGVTTTLARRAAR